MVRKLREYMGCNKAKKVVLFLEVGLLKKNLSLTWPHSRTEYIFCFKKTHTHKQKAKKTKEKKRKTKETKQEKKK